MPNLLKLIAILLLLSCVVILALVIGQSMTADIISVVLGAAAGVFASLPTAILLTALVRRAQQRTAAKQPKIAIYMPEPLRLSPGRGGTNADIGTHKRAAS